MINREITINVLDVLYRKDRDQDHYAFSKSLGATIEGDDLVFINLIKGRYNTPKVPVVHKDIFKMPLPQLLALIENMVDINKGVISNMVTYIDRPFRRNIYDYIRPSSDGESIINCNMSYTDGEWSILVTSRIDSKERYDGFYRTNEFHLASMYMSYLTTCVELNIQPNYLTLEDNDVTFDIEKGEK